eukprot:754655-Hanusia_phi.AAC.5
MTSAHQGSNSQSSEIFERVIVSPRVKPGELKGQPLEVQLDLAVLEPLYCFKQEEAAERLGICLTSLKSACRKLGLKRWPYTKRDSYRTKGAPRDAAAASALLPDPDDSEQSTIHPGLEGLRLSDRLDETHGEALHEPFDSSWVGWYLGSCDQDPDPYFPSNQVEI